MIRDDRIIECRIRIEEIQDITLESNLTEEAGLNTPLPLGSMIALVWNCREFRRPVAARALRVLVNLYKPSNLFLSKLKISDVDCVSRKFRTVGFVNIYVVLACGLLRGISLFLKNDAYLRIVVSNSSMINSLIFFDRLMYLGNSQLFMLHQTRLFVLLFGRT